jgi:hypothetical protein
MIRVPSALLPLPFLGLSLASPLLAQDDVNQRLQQLEQKNAELEAKFSALADAQEHWTLGGLVPAAGESQYGMGPSASKVYASDEGLSIGGYGEVLYSRRNGDAADELDFLRAVLYVGYRFDEHWIFNSEFEWEHAGEEVEVEFGYLDYLWREELNLRMGMVLVPMGFLNELHEPPTYLPATRTEVETRILPTTWREIGVGAFGTAGPVSYRGYVMSSFDALGFTDEGLRDGRQEGIEALAEDLAVVGRLDWTETPGLLAGGSLYYGQAGQDQPGLGSTGVTIGELHAEWHASGLWVRGLATRAMVDDVAELNAANGFTGTDSVGEELEGEYVEGGYDLLALLAPESSQSLSPYARFETIDTQADVPSGFASDPANDTDNSTIGLNWRPRSNIVFKLEYQDFEESEDGWNLSMGWSF